MRIGFIGLGKLGLPCAVATALRGHDVMGYDINPTLMNKQPRPYQERGPAGIEPFNPYLEASTLRFGSLREVVDHAELLFLAVQTPHTPMYEGVTRLPSARADFSYTYLCDAVAAISEVTEKPTTLAVISTVLPGTMRAHVMPLVHPLLRLCYNPFFIAMGTTMRDFLNPEFVLLGVASAEAAAQVEAFYRTIVSAPVLRMSIESAELTKMAYNTFIGMKLVFANTMMEIAHKLPGVDINDVMSTLKQGSKRLISPTYLDGGMGDGGGCHPRDNIAMSWLARRLSLSHDFFEDLMLAREHQTAWLADLMCAYDLPKAILGYSFKPETNLTVGSPALLLKNLLEERGHQPLLYDPHVEGQTRDLSTLQPHVFLIGSRHACFRTLQVPKGSIVIDPWRHVKQPGPEVTLIALGQDQQRLPVMQ